MRLVNRFLNKVGKLGKSGYYPLLVTYFYILQQFTKVGMKVWKKKEAVKPGQMTQLNEKWVNRVKVGITQFFDLILYNERI